MNSINNLIPIEKHSYYVPYRHTLQKENRMVDRINREFISTYRDYAYDGCGNRVVTERSFEAKV